MPAGSVDAAGLLASDALLRETAAALAYNLSLVLPKDDSDAVVEVTSAVAHQLQTETVPATGPYA